MPVHAMAHSRSKEEIKCLNLFVVVELVLLFKSSSEPGKNYEKTLEKQLHDRQCR